MLEIIVSTLILAFVAAIAAGSLRAITGSSRLIEASIEGKTIQRQPVSILKEDLQNFYRDVDPRYIRFNCQYQEDGVQHLKFYTVSSKKARPNSKETDVYEVEYYNLATPDGNYLMRRYWPNPSDELEPAGLLSVVGCDIIMFDVQMWDGKTWVDEWVFEDKKKLPYMIEIGLWFWKDKEDIPQRRSFLITWPRMGQPAANDQEDPFSFEEKETAQPEI